MFEQFDRYSPKIEVCNYYLVQKNVLPDQESFFVCDLTSQSTATWSCQDGQLS